MTRTMSMKKKEKKKEIGIKVVGFGTIGTTSTTLLKDGTKMKKKELNSTIRSMMTIRLPTLLKKVTSLRLKKS